MRGRKRYALRLQYRGLGRLEPPAKILYPKPCLWFPPLRFSFPWPLRPFSASSPSNDAIICHLTELGRRSGRICASKMWKRAERNLPLPLSFSFSPPSCFSAAAKEHEPTRSLAIIFERSRSSARDFFRFHSSRKQRVFLQREKFLLFNFNFWE